MTKEIQVDQALSAIRALAWKASSLVGEDVDYWHETGREPEYSKVPQVAEAIEIAFLQLLALSETLGLKALGETILATYREAREVGLGKFEWFEDHSAWSLWSGPVQQFADAIEAVFGTKQPTAGAVFTDLLTLLKNTQNAITDKRCFQPPKNEAEVHDRIEVILKCVYPDLLRKPPLSKPVVNFIPDSGIPSISTLIEYKFMSEEGQAGQIANEILADTRGYAESGWGRIVFVIYETKRFKTPHEWQQLLFSCGLKTNIQLIVLHGEEPNQGKKAPAAVADPAAAPKAPASKAPASKAPAKDQGT